jgi:MipA family protein
LTVGAAGFTAPAFEGSRRYILSGVPIISLGKRGKEAPFVSRNDNISFAFVDTGTFRVGAVGKLVMPRDASDHPELAGLSDIPFGVEVGGFAEIYPVEWLRLRGEVRRGIRAHEGFVGNVQVDAFADVTESVRVSAGPRLSFADAAYMDAYYGVSAAEAAASGLTAYSPGGGIKSAGVGGAVDWRVTDKVTTSVFAEYSRLMGPAANSSIVAQRGSKNQFMLGLSATYRFDFKL